MAQDTRDYLDRRGVIYDYIDIEADRAAAQWVRGQNGGKERTPTVDIAGKILVEPGDAQLEQVLRNKHILD
jgi:mycoredoxin